MPHKVEPAASDVVVEVGKRPQSREGRSEDSSLPALPETVLRLISVA